MTAKQSANESTKTASLLDGSAVLLRALPAQKGKHIKICCCGLHSGLFCMQLPRSRCSLVSFQINSRELIMACLRKQFIQQTGYSGIGTLN